MATTQHRPHGAFAGPLFGTLSGKTEDTGPTANPITQHRPHGAFTGQRYGTLSGKGGAGAATITAVDPVSGTELQVTWTGTASRYRLDGGTPVTLPDGTSPDTISGLTPNTLYAVEIDNGDGNWSNSVSEWTDNTGGGGGALNIAAGPAEASAAGVTALVSSAINAGPAEATAAGVTAVLQFGDALQATPGEAAASGVFAHINSVLQAGPGSASAAGVSASIIGTADRELVSLRSYITTQVALSSAAAAQVSLVSHV